MKRQNIAIPLIMFLAAWMTMTACKQYTVNDNTGDKSQNIPEEAVCVLHPTSGNSVHGIVKFKREGSRIRVNVHMEGLSEGNHGFHVHQYGDCSAEDGTSAGGHFNPYNNSHGSPSDSERHVGDLGNIIADSEGTVNMEFLDTVISFEGPSSIIGRAIIVHAGEDDLVSQPTGDAGARVACGVIGIAGK
jgi:Cu-Zn family superoxide dismutase